MYMYTSVKNDLTDILRKTLMKNVFGSFHLVSKYDVHR